MDPSEEQQTIIDNIKNEKNVVVDAVAGSGKSTTILFLAKQLTDKRILQVTYNSALRLEVKKKIEESEISNVQVHTFHSLAVRYYSPIAHTDTELRKILRNDVEPREKIPHFDIVVLDEVQDMTKLYFMFIRKFMTDMGKTDLQLLILGDFMQGLYEFKGSDVRYLTLADKIWNNFPLLKTNEFVSCSLKMSYRITNPMADFVNKVMLGEKRLLSCKEGSAVVYIRNSGEPLYMMIYHMIMGLLKEGNKPEDIFFLGPSMKNSIKKLENVLVERNIPCYVPMFDKEKIDDRVIDGKIVFSTFHSVKGRQRKFV
jgi:superfamily I DNA/RNA helicase